MNTLNNSTTQIKQGTTVYHEEYGKGFVLNVTYKKSDNLVMCYFPQAKAHEWILESNLRKGTENVTLTKMGKRETEPQPSLDDLLTNLFRSAK
jgi:hypothetical protein